jgi:hypothetical protein
MVEKTELFPLFPAELLPVPPVPPAPTVTVYAVPTTKLSGFSAEAPPPEVPALVR